jgi:hypothetical protein
MRDADLRSANFFHVGRSGKDSVRGAGTIVTMRRRVMALYRGDGLRGRRDPALVGREASAAGRAEGVVSVEDQLRIEP